MGEYRIDSSAPNLVNVCIDCSEETGKRGRLYCCYDKVPFRFENELQMTRRMEKLMDQLNYPQSSVKSRSYQKKEGQTSSEKPEKVLESSQILKERGAEATLVIQVQYRQNATWQGRMLHVETEQSFEFLSVLELLKLMDHIV